MGEGEGREWVFCRCLAKGEAEPFSSKSDKKQPRLPTLLQIPVSVERKMRRDENYTAHTARGLAKKSSLGKKTPQKVVGRLP